MKLLIAVDGSDSSDHALTLTKILAGPRAHHAEMVYVVPPVVELPGSVEKSFTQLLKENGEAMLALLSRRLQDGTALAVAPHVLESDNVAEAILNRAAQMRSELIVIGTRGQGPLKRLLWGSVSRTVAREAHCAVLVAHPAPLRHPLRILAAVDGSAPSRKALHFLEELGAPAESEMLLACVTEAPAAYVVPEFVGSALAAQGYQDMLDKDRRMRETLLQKWEADLRVAFPHIESVVTEGDPASEIVRIAKTRAADLIVLGRRHLGAFDRWVGGGISRNVSNHAHCSVLIVP